MPNPDHVLTRGHLYPLAEYEPVPDQCAGVRRNKVRFGWTGEKRRPKAGEWFLSGAIIEAYRAPNDLLTPYHIAVPVKLMDANDIIALIRQHMAEAETFTNTMHARGDALNERGWASRVQGFRELLEDIPGTAEAIDKDQRESQHEREQESQEP